MRQLSEHAQSRGDDQMLRKRIFKLNTNDLVNKGLIGVYVEGIYASGIYDTNQSPVTCCHLGAG